MKSCSICETKSGTLIQDDLHYICIDCVEIKLQDIDKSLTKLYPDNMLKDK